jgi:hypothetical protein
MSDTAWTPIARVGTPDVVAKSQGIKVRIKVFPSIDESWRAHFRAKFQELGGGDGGFAASNDGIWLEVSDAELESSVALVDAAIDFANTQYEQVEIPKKREEEREWNAAGEQAIRRQADLATRAEALAKPPLPLGKPSRDW